MTLKTLEALTHHEHSRKVSQISGMLAEFAGYSPADTKIIERAAAFHDIGKIYVSEDILSKNGALTSEEYEIVKTHTTVGSEKIYDVIRMLAAADCIAASHHERPDGSGLSGATSATQTKRWKPA